MHAPGDQEPSRQELQMLLPTTGILTGALAVLPFMSRFGHGQRDITAIYLAALLCALGALVLFGIPRIGGRRQRSPRDLEGCETWAARRAAVGLWLLSAALILITLAVLTHVVTDPRVPLLATGAIGAVTVTTWWVVPHRRRNRETP